MSTYTAIAKTVSRALNPFAISIVVLLVATYAGTNNLREFGTWTLIILFFSVILPLAFVYVRSSGKGSLNKKMPELVSFLRERRKEIWVLGIIAGVPFISLLIILRAPTILIATLVALFGSCLVIALVNRFFKASYHISSVTILAIAAVVIWGQAALLALLIIPLVGWARFSAREHSPIQLAVGFAIAFIIDGASLYGFGVPTLARSL